MSDEQFADEKNFLLQKLAALPASGAGSSGNGNGNGNGNAIAGY